MQSTVTFYKNTGFDAINVPDSPALLSTFESFQCNAIYTKQRTSLSSIKVETTYETLLQVDYCKLENVYYLVGDYIMLNDNVANVLILEDSVTTLGGYSSIDIVDGWCTRKSVSDDTLFSNVIPESFAPSLPFVIDNYKLLNTDYNYDNSLSIVLSTVDLTAADLLKADVYVGTSEEPGDVVGVTSVTVPALPSLSDETVIGIRCKELDAEPYVLSTKYPNIGMYDYNNSYVNTAIQKLRGLGLESVIVGCYKIPDDFVFTVTRETEIASDRRYGKITELIVGSKTDMFNNISTSETLRFVYGSEGYTPKNNKVYSQFNNLTIFSATSGDSFSAEMHSLYDGGVIPDFTITPNPSKVGAPYCRPDVYEGEHINRYNFFLNGVHGSSWVNTPITMTEASGNLVNAANYSITKSINQNLLASAGWKYEDRTYQNIADSFDGLLAGGSSMLSMYKGYTNTKQVKIKGTKDEYMDVDSPRGYEGVGGGFVNNAMSIAQSGDRSNDTFRNFQNLAADAFKKQMAYEIQQNLVVPSVSFGQEPDLQLYLGIGFFAYTLRLAQGDLERFDNYLTRYGYKVSEILTNECFSGRQNFNYVEGKGVTVLSNSQYANRTRRINAAKQIEGGVRVWHTKPSELRMYDNPISTT